MKIATITCPKCSGGFKLKFAVPPKSVSCASCKVRFPFPLDAVVQAVPPPGANASVPEASAIRPEEPSHHVAEESDTQLDCVDTPGVPATAKTGRLIALVGVVLILLSTALPWATKEYAINKENLVRGTSSVTSNKEVSIPVAMLVGQGHDKGDALVAAIFIVPVLVYGLLLALGKWKPFRVVLLAWSLLVPGVFISSAVEHNQRVKNYRAPTPSFHQGYAYVGGTISRPVRTPFPVAPCAAAAVVLGLIAAESFGLRSAKSPGMSRGDTGELDRLAIWTISLGAASIVLGPLSGIPAIIWGHKTLKRTRASATRGAGLAIGGLVLGYLTLVGFLAALILPIVVR